MVPDELRVGGLTCVVALRCGGCDAQVAVLCVVPDFSMSTLLLAILDALQKKLRDLFPAKPQDPVIRCYLEVLRSFESGQTLEKNSKGIIRSDRHFM